MYMASMDAELFLWLDGINIASESVITYLFRSVNVITISCNTNIVSSLIFSYNNWFPAYQQESTALCI